MKIIARLLEKGDVFDICGCEYVVLATGEDGVIYRSVSGGHAHLLGANSRRKFLLIKDCLVGDVENLHPYMTGEFVSLPKPKKKTKPFKQYSISKPINKKIRQADKLRLTTSSHF